MCGQLPVSDPKLHQAPPLFGSCAVLSDVAFRDFYDSTSSNFLRGVIRNEVFRRRHVMHRQIYIYIYIYPCKHNQSIVVVS